VRGLGRKKQPLRVVLSRSGRLPRHAYIFNDRFAKQTVVYRSSSLDAVLKDLGRKNFTSVLIEGGGEILGQALDQQLIDKVQLYFGPIFTGGPVFAFSGRGVGSTAAAARLSRISYHKIGNDVYVIGYPIYPEHAPAE
jgi:Pyrimidine reductase, riboflavin biosynthesis